MGNGVHGLLGPNGAGKTTLVRALATVLRPAGGTLSLLGQPVGGGIDLQQVRRQVVAWMVQPTHTTAATLTALVLGAGGALADALLGPAG